MLTQRWLISGRVQGVGYRAWLTSEARACRVQGWVRNLDDGRVEAMVQGAAPILAGLLRQAECGPAAAHVLQVQVEEWAASRLDGPFASRPTSSSALADRSLDDCF